MHPTVEAYNLKTYVASFATKCCICRQTFENGQTIARLTPELMADLQLLGISKSKTRKYLHVTCLPPILPSELVDPLKSAVIYLKSCTDPRWPEDFIGFAKSEDGPCTRWIESGFHPIAAHRVAKKLLRYIHTQLTGEIADSIRLAARYGDLLLDPKFAAGMEPPAQKPASSQDPLPPLPPPEVPPIDAPTHGDQPKDEMEETERKNKGIVFIRRDETDPDFLNVDLDPYWVNPDHGKVKDLIKAEGARYSGSPGCYWTIKVQDLARVVPQIIEITKLIQVAPGVKELLQKSLQRFELSTALTIDPNSPFAKRLEGLFPDGLELLDFQKACVRFIEETDGLALVADAMGTGKTIEAIGYLALHPELRPALVVCPAAASVNWHRELWKWLPDSSVLRLKSSKDYIIKTSDVVIITYDLLSRLFEKLMTIFKFKIVVADECHAIKNDKTLRNQSLTQLVATQQTKFIPMSGTPITNRPKEFFPVLHLLDPVEFKSKTLYEREFCGAKKVHIGRGRFAMEAKGASNIPKLVSKLRTRMRRITKADVLKDLPPLTRRKINLELTDKEAKFYDDELEKARKQLIAMAQVAGEEVSNAAIVLSHIGVARQVIGKIKVKYALDQIRDYVDQDLPLVVCAHHDAVLEELKTECEKFCRVGLISGKVSQDQRGEIVDAMQEGRLDVLLLSIKTGVAFTVTRASYVLFVERAWTPGDEEQAEARTHRKGQVNAVTVDYLVTDSSIDTMMDALIEEKREILNQILDGKPVECDDLDIRKELIEQWKTQVL